jgi:hypothetical protein
VLHSFRCIVFGCLDSNPGLNSNLFACFRKELELEKKKKANLPPSPAFVAAQPREVRRQPLIFSPRPRVARAPSPASLARQPSLAVRTAAQLDLPAQRGPLTAVPARAASSR